MKFKIKPEDGCFRVQYKFLFWWRNSYIDVCDGSLINRNKESSLFHYQAKYKTVNSAQNAIDRYKESR